MYEAADVERIRVKWGWTQEHLSHLLNRSISQICRYEKGISNLPITVQHMLADLDENGHLLGKQEREVDEIKEEIRSVLNTLHNRSAVERLLAYLNKLAKEYPS